jgi:hypothetical protein
VGRLVFFSFQGLHWIITADPTSEKSLAKIVDATAGGGTPPGELWRHTAPYRGLSAMTESDTDFFFGRGRETTEVIKALATMPDKLPVLLGNSGVGKSSLAQAGVLAAFMRQAGPETAEIPGGWPPAFSESRRRCVLKLKPGTEPVRALVEPFLVPGNLTRLPPSGQSCSHAGSKNFSPEPSLYATFWMQQSYDTATSYINPSHRHSYFILIRVRSFTYVQRSTNAAAFWSCLQTVLPIRVCTR